MNGQGEDILSFLQKLGSGEHGCLFYTEERDKDRILTDFIRVGLDAGDYCVFASTRESSGEAVYDLLQDTGFKLRDLEESLVVVQGEQLYESAEQPNIKKWLSTLDAVHSEALAKKKKGVRVAADLSSYFVKRGLLQQWFDLEVSLGRTLNRGIMIICAYDLNLLTMNRVVNVLDFYNGLKENRNDLVDSHGFALFPIERNKGLILKMD